MKILARPMGTGKTRELMEMALETDGIILTTNKRALQVKADAYGFDSLCIIDLEDLFHGEYDSAKPLFIHKLDDVAREYLLAECNLNLQGFSVRMED